MEQLNNLDVVFLIVIGISALVGIARGMTKEILSIVGWVLAAVATFYLTPIVNPITKNYIASDVLAGIVSGMVVLIGFCIVWILIVDSIASVIRRSKLSMIDRLFGFVFGAARGGLIVVLFALMVSTLIPAQSQEGMLADSKILKEASLYVEPVKAMIPQEWVESAKEKAISLGLLTEKNENADGEATDGENDKKGSVGDNLDVLKKTGGELFDKLAQPKPAADGEDAGDPSASDLDKLLDVLEDNIINSEEGQAAASSATQKITDKVVDKIAEKVADKVVNGGSAPAKKK